MKLKLKNTPLFHFEAIYIEAAVIVILVAIIGVWALPSIFSSNSESKEQHIEYLYESLDEMISIIHLKALKTGIVHLPKTDKNAVILIQETPIHLSFGYPEMTQLPSIVQIFPEYDWQDLKVFSQGYSFIEFGFAEEDCRIRYQEADQEGEIAKIELYGKSC